jgi:hypothetical protein
MSIEWCVMPNVRAKRATTAGRQAQGGENVQRTCLVPCDHVPVRSWPLFRAREIMPALIESIKQGKKS